MPEARFQYLARLAVLAGLIVWGPSCQTGTPAAGPQTHSTGPGATTRSAPAPTADLAGVLQHAVTSGGWVVVDNLQERAGLLQAYLDRLATHGPTTTPGEYPTGEDRLAYWLNARTACSLKLGLLAGCPPRLTPAQLSGAFRLDGRTLHLEDIDAALAAEGGWRALCGAPGVTMDRAAPPRRPFVPGDVRAALQERVDAFVHDAERFEIDVDTRQVRLPAVFWGQRGRLIEQYARASGAKSPTLWSALQDGLGGLARQRLQDAVGYQVVEAPADGQTCFKKWYELLN
ncbi:MAG: hypothetical protein NTV86_03320 [Planctomycetota bacterium]|nr:hypothetical protein [Planctomycetota bacterium]